MMWAVSDRFLEALKYPHQVATRVTCTINGVAEEVQIGREASVSVDGTNRIRRRANLKIIGSKAYVKRLRTPGAVFQIEHGIQFSDGPEYVPVFTGELSPGGQAFGSYEAPFTLVDWGAWLARTGLVSPYTPTFTTSRVAAIQALVVGGRPGTTFINTAGGRGYVGDARMWTGSRLEAISELARDAGVEAYFLPDGRFTTHLLPSVSSTPVWSISPGEGGTLMGGSVDQQLESGPNTVVVRPSAWWQTWTQQRVSITNPDDPRHPSKVGVIPMFIDSPTAETAGSARQIGLSQLWLNQGAQDSLQLTAIANPALEGGDVIRVVTPQIGDEEADVYQHYVTGFTLNLATGAMDVRTRMQVVTGG